MTLDELLKSAARDVADSAPATYLAPSEIRSRALTTRRRQRAGLGAGIVAATAVVAVGLQVIGGGAKDAQEPMPAPSPSPSPTPGSSTAPGVPIVEVPEITPDDLREYEELETVTNTQPGNEGLTEFTFEVSMRDKYGYEVGSFCSGDPDTWIAYVVGKDGAQGFGRCDGDIPQQFPTFPTDLAPFGHTQAPATRPVRVFVTQPSTPEQLDCLYQRSPYECRNLVPPLEPLASTTVAFGVSVYEYSPPAVTTLMGYDVAARASAEGIDYVLSQVLTPGAGQHRFSTTLPATEGDRIVAVLDGGTDTLADCHRAAGADEAAYEACTAVLELRIGDRVVALERGVQGDVDLFRSPFAFFRVPAGEQEVELSVALGDPDHIHFALVVFEETP